MKKTTLLILLAVGFTAFFSSCGREEWPDLPDTTFSDTTVTETHDTVPAPCNGNSNLCYKRYSEVSYPMTEKSYACETCTVEFLAPFHEFPVNRQLRDGIRALSFDIVENGGSLEVRYLFDFFGTQPFSVVLDEVAAFMEENPREVVTIFLRPDGDIPGSLISEAFDAAGLSDLAYGQPRYQLWPRLVDMIALNHRLVVFSNGNPSPSDPDWLMSELEHVVSTEDQTNNVDEYTCTMESGDPFNQLFRINNFVVKTTVDQYKAAAEEGDSYDVLYPRVMECSEAMGKTANFISVHWYGIGEVIRVVDTLNYSGDKHSIE